MFLYCSKNIILPLILFSIAGILYPVSGICQQERYIFNEISTITGTSPEIADIAIDSNKNIIVCGNLRGSAQFNNQNFNHSQNFPFVAKLDSAHNIIWIEGQEVPEAGIGISGARPVRFDLVQLDEDGNIYASGFFANPLTNPNAHLDSITYGNHTIDFTGYSNDFPWVRVIFKFTPNGNVSWSRYGFDSDREPNLVYKNGYVYFTMESTLLYYNNHNNALVRTVNGDVLNYPTHVNNNASNFAILKVDTAGNTVWYRTVAHNSTVLGQPTTDLQGLEVDDFDNIYLIGRGGTNPVFNNGPNVFTAVGSGRDPFVIKIDSSGNLVNSKRFLNIPGPAMGGQRTVALKSAFTGNSLYVINATHSPTNYDNIAAPQGFHALKIDSALNPVESFSLLTNSQSFRLVPFFKSFGDQLVYAADIFDTTYYQANPLAPRKESILTVTDTTFGNDVLVKYLQFDFGQFNFSSPVGARFLTAAAYPDNGWVTSGGVSRDAILDDHQFNVGSSSNTFIANAIKCTRPNINLSTDALVICGPGGAVNLSAQGNGSFNYRWFIDSTRILGASGQNYTAGSAGDYMFESDSLGCKDTSNALTVSVSSQPAVFTFPAFETFCSSSLPMRLLGGVPSGGIWHGNGMVNDSVFDPAVSGLGVHFLWYVYENSAGCIDSAMRLVTVEPGPQPTLFPPDFCTSDQLTDLSPYAFPQGGVFSGNGFIGGNQFNPQLTGAGTTGVQYTVMSSTGCMITDSTTIYVDPGPTIILPQMPDVCDSQTFIILPSASPAVGTWSGNNVAGGLFFTQGLAPGSHEVIYEASQNGCSARDTAVINLFPENSIFSLPSVICESDSPHIFQVYPPGGNFSGAGVVNDSLFNPAIAGAGNFTIDYATNNVCGTDTASRNITVLPHVQSQINPLPQICESDSAIALTGTPAGGTFSGPGIFQNQLLPDVAEAGSIEIVYTAQGNNLCPSYDTLHVNILPAPVISTSFPDSLCQSSGLISLNASPAGGVFSGSNITGNDFDTDTVQGDYLVYYTYQDSNQCTSTAKDTVVIYNVPAPSWNVPDFLCNDLQQRVLLEGTPGGGTISGAHITGNIFDVQAAGDGLHPLEYSINTTCGVKTAYDTIRVEDKVNVTHPPVIEGCAADSIVFLTGGSPAGGYYTGANIFVDMYFPPAPQADTFSTQYVLTLGGCADTAAVTVALSEPPVTVINIQDSVCLNTTPFSLTGSPTGGVFSGVGITGNQFNPAAADTGLHLIEYQFTDSIGCSAYDTGSLLVYDTDPPQFSVPKSVCLNAAPFPLTNHFPAGGTFSGTGVSQGEFHPAAAGLGLHPITYTVNTDCGPKSTTDTIEVMPLPMANLPALPDLCNTDTLYITGGSPQGGNYFGDFVDSNAFNAFASGAGQFTVFYRYTDSNMCSDTAATAIQVRTPPGVQFQFQDTVCANSPPLNLPQGHPLGGNLIGGGVFNQLFHADSVGLGLHEIIYEYYDSNGCFGADTHSILVHSEPSPVWTPPTGICANSTPVALTGGHPAGGTFSGSGVTNNVFNPTTAGTGNHVIQYTVQTLCGLKSTIDTITVNSLPTVGLDNIPSTCSNANPKILNEGSPQGGVYSGNYVSNGHFNPSSAGAGVHTVYYTYTNNVGCAATDSQLITVNSLPQVTLNNFTPICFSDTLIPLTEGSPQGGIYSGPGITNNFINPQNAGSGSRLIFYTYADSNGCSNFDFKNLQIFPQPTGNFNLPTSICLNDDSVQITSISPSGGFFESDAVSDLNFFRPDKAETGQNEITYFFTDNIGCAGSHSKNIEVLNIPEYEKNDVTVCRGSSVSLSINSTETVLWYGTTQNPHTIMPQDSAHYHFKVTSSEGCEVWDSVFVAVVDVPEIDLGEDLSVCDTGQLVLGSDQKYHRYLWNTGSTSSKTTLYPAILSRGNHLYWLEAATIGGCTKRDSIFITIRNCPNTSARGVNSKDAEFNVYPNPAQNEFFIDVISSVHDDVTVTLRSGTGAVVRTLRSTINQKFSRIAFEGLNLESGIYFISLKGDKLYFNKPIVIIK